ncbi:MAG: class I SAM-dependent methyltransferase [Mariprofundaceae bacterium]|nr:class I SAM-dependent methyltransferase [Mariprofundaceae bacterium]
MNARVTTGHSAWDVSDVDLVAFRQALHGMASSIAVGHALALLPELPPKARSIEIGCGLGKMSALMGLAGVSPVLFDSSQATLDEARKAFHSIDVSVECVLGDALDLPSEVIASFDLSMSWGLNEHFSGKPRQKIFDAHAEVLKENGWSIIGVPCRNCISYRMAMLVWKLTGRWPKGLYEYGFDRSELARRMQQAGFKKIKVLSGTRPGDDFRHYILGNLRAVVHKFTGLFPKDKPPDIKGATISDIRQKLLESGRPNEFLSSQSYMLIAIGQKKMINNTL